jgi:hypothetical protein
MHKGKIEDGTNVSALRSEFELHESLFVVTGHTISIEVHDAELELPFTLSLTSRTLKMLQIDIIRRCRKNQE